MLSMLRLLAFRRYCWPRQAGALDRRQAALRRGLKQGERYSVTLRADLPSAVNKQLAKSADINIYVRDRSPFVRFTSRAYVLPRTGGRAVERKITLPVMPAAPMIGVKPLFSGGSLGQGDTATFDVVVVANSRHRSASRGRCPG